MATRARSTRALAGLLSVLIAASPLRAGADDVWSERRARRPGRTLLASLPSSSPFAADALPEARPRVLEDASALLPPAASPGLAGLVRELSPAHGRVRRVLPPSGRASGRTVVFIQDVHLHEEAQRNAAALIARLAEKGRVDLVGLEGAFGPVPLADARAWPRRDDVRAAADALLAAGEIPGAVLAGLTGGADFPPVVGVDDRAEHGRNVEAYRRSAPAAEGLRAALADRRRENDKRKAEAFNPRLAAFDKALSAHRDGTMPLGDYVAALAEAAGGAGENAGRFLAALAAERGMDFARVETERRRLIEALAGAASRGQMEELVRWSAAYRAGEIGYGSFYRRLSGLCGTAGVSLKDFPAFRDYVSYVEAADRVDAEGLLAELRALERRALERLAKTEAERRLAAEAARIHLADKLISFTLTPPEWAELAADPAGVDEDLAPFAAFYREAEARNHSMARNLLAAMDGAGARTAVLVAGGFHTEGIEALLARAGAACVTVAPKITRVDGMAGSEYLSAFTREETPLERLFDAEKLTVAPALKMGLVRRVLALMLDCLDGQAVGAPARALAPEMLREVTLTQTGTTVTARGRENVVTVSHRGDRSPRFLVQEKPLPLAFRLDPRRILKENLLLLAPAAASLLVSLAAFTPEGAPGLLALVLESAVFVGGGAAAGEAFLNFHRRKGAIGLYGPDMTERRFAWGVRGVWILTVLAAFPAYRFVFDGLRAALPPDGAGMLLLEGAAALFAAWGPAGYFGHGILGNVLLYGLTGVAGVAENGNGNGGNGTGRWTFSATEKAFRPEHRFMTVALPDGTVHVNRRFKSLIKHVDGSSLESKHFDEEFPVRVVWTKHRAGVQDSFEGSVSQEDCPTCAQAGMPDVYPLDVGHGYQMLPEESPYTGKTGTIVRTEHQYPVIDRDLVESMLQALYELGPERYRVGYNHRKAGGRNKHQLYKVFEMETPIETATPRPLIRLGDVRVFYLPDFPMKALVIESKSFEALAGQLMRIERLLDVLEMPFSLLLTRRTDGTFRIFVELRRAGSGRPTPFPDKFFGVAEASGLVLFDKPADYHREDLREALVQSYREITVSDQEFKNFLHVFKAHEAVFALAKRHGFDYEIDVTGTYFYTFLIPELGEALKCLRPTSGPMKEHRQDHLSKPYQLVRERLGDRFVRAQAVDIRYDGRFVAVSGDEEPGYIVQDLQRARTVAQRMPELLKEGASATEEILRQLDRVARFQMELLHRGLFDISHHQLMGAVSADGEPLSFDLSHIRETSNGTNVLGTEGYAEMWVDAFNRLIADIALRNPAAGEAARKRFGGLTWKGLMKLYGFVLPFTQEDRDRRAVGMPAWEPNLVVVSRGDKPAPPPFRIMRTRNFRNLFEGIRELYAEQMRTAFVRFMDDGNQLRLLVADAEGRMSPVYKTLPHASAWRDGQVALLMNIGRANRPGRAGIKDARIKETDPAAHRLTPDSVREVPEQIPLEWKSPLMKLWWIIMDPFSIWPPKPGVPVEEQPLTFTVTRGDEAVTQPHMSDAETIEDLAHLMLQANALLPTGATGFRISGNGWYASDADDAVSGGATQFHVHGRMARVPLLIENAPRAPLLGVDLVDISLIDDGLNPALVLEVDAKRVPVLARLASDILSRFNRNGRAFNYTLAPADEEGKRVRLFITGRTKTRADAFPNTWGFVEMGRMIVVDDLERFYDLTPGQKDGLRAAKDKIEWFKENEPALTLNKSLLEDVRKGLVQLSASAEELEEVVLAAADHEQEIRKAPPTNSFLYKWTRDWRWGSAGFAAEWIGGLVLAVQAAMGSHAVFGDPIWAAALSIGAMAVPLFAYSLAHAAVGREPGQPLLAAAFSHFKGFIPYALLPAGLILAPGWEGVSAGLVLAFHAQWDMRSPMGRDIARALQVNPAEGAAVAAAQARIARAYDEGADAGEMGDLAADILEELPANLGVSRFSARGARPIEAAGGFLLDLADRWAAARRTDRLRALGAGLRAAGAVFTLYGLRRFLARTLTGTHVYIVDGEDLARDQRAWWRLVSELGIRFDAGQYAFIVPDEAAKAVLTGWGADPAAVSVQPGFGAAAGGRRLVDVAAFEGAQVGGRPLDRHAAVTFHATGRVQLLADRVKSEPLREAARRVVLIDLLNALPLTRAQLDAIDRVARAILSAA